MNDPRLRRFAPLLLIAFGALLYLPGLNAFGLWDPSEIKVADAARNLLGHDWWKLASQAGRPPALLWLVAAGFEKIGVNELGGRLPVTLVSIATLVAVFYAGRRLVSTRAALLSALALAVTPSFVLGARQLTTNAPLLFSSALSLGGLARAAWPERPGGLYRLLHLGLGLMGLALGLLSGAVFIGVLAPLLTVTIAVVAAGGPVGVTLLGGLLSAAALAAGLLAAEQHTGFSVLLGGAPHAITHAVVFSTVVKQAVLAYFPWIVFLPYAGALVLSEELVVDREGARARFSRTLLFAWFIALYLAGTLQSVVSNELLIPMGPVVVLLFAATVDHLLSSSEQRPYVGLMVAVGAFILGRDYDLFPELYLGAHSIEPIRVPALLPATTYAILAYALFFGAAMGLAIGAPLERPSAPPGRNRRLLLGAGGVIALVMAFATAHWIVPQASRHLSARDLYGKAKALDPDAPIGQYRFTASGASFYARGRAPTNLQSLEEVLKFLGRGERVFVMAGADELGAIDQKAREQRSTYFVIDDSNARFITLSNRLGAGEEDLNPLRRFISESPPTPQHPMKVDWSGKLELLGYDLPNEVRRGEDFKVRLYFKVNQPVGSSYKVFIHFDGPGSRINGDHVPLASRFPTQYWVPGYYITDEHLMKPDRAMQPAGPYQVYMGLFAGDQRMKVVSGPQDGDNRVRLGTLLVK